MAKAIVFIIDGDPAVRDSLETFINLNGHDVATYATGGAFLGELYPHDIKCVICEAELPDTTGFAVFEALAKQHFHPPFALLISHGSRRIFEKAVRFGIAHVLS